MCAVGKRGAGPDGQGSRHLAAHQCFCGDGGTGARDRQPGEGSAWVAPFSAGVAKWQLCLSDRPV